MSKKIDNKERRFGLVEARAAAEDEKLILEGYAAVFGSETAIGEPENGWGFYESIDRSAFDEADMSDVCCKYNHNDSMTILARTRNKSLTLTVDDKGLFVRIELQGNVQAHRDAYNMVQSGLLDKMSFAFSLPYDADCNCLGQRVEMIDGVKHRTVTKIERLYDVSIVDVPAYGDTSIFARSLELVDTDTGAAEADAEAAKADAERRAFEVLRLKNANRLKLEG